MLTAPTPPIATAQERPRLSRPIAAASRRQLAPVSRAAAAAAAAVAAAPWSTPSTIAEPAVSRHSPCRLQEADTRRPTGLSPAPAPPPPPPAPSPRPPSSPSPPKCDGATSCRSQPGNTTILPGAGCNLNWRKNGCRMHARRRKSTHRFSTSHAPRQSGERCAALHADRCTQPIIQCHDNVIVPHRRGQDIRVRGRREQVVPSRVDKAQRPGPGSLDFQVEHPADRRELVVVRRWRRQTARKGIVLDGETVEALTAERKTDTALQQLTVPAAVGVD
eukprot:SAG22_NODE_907_length_6555_cov_19.560099_3_plen_276_part_00